MSQELANQITQQVTDHRSKDGKPTRWEKRLALWQRFAQLESAFLAHNPAPYAFPLAASGARAAGAIAGMPMRSWVFTGARMRAAGLLRGCSPKQLAQSDGAVRSSKIAASTTDPADRALHAVGAALSSKSPVLCLLGKTALANGGFYEALNTASLTAATVIFAIIDTDISQLPLSAQHNGDVAALAQASLGSSDSITELELSNQNEDEQFLAVAKCVEQCATQMNGPAVLILK